MEAQFRKHVLSHVIIVYQNLLQLCHLQQLQLSLGRQLAHAAIIRPIRTEATQLGHVYGLDRIEKNILIDARMKLC